MIACCRLHTAEGGRRYTEQHVWPQHEDAEPAPHPVRRTSSLPSSGNVREVVFEQLSPRGLHVRMRITDASPRSPTEDSEFVLGAPPPPRYPKIAHGEAVQITAQAGPAPCQAVYAPAAAPGPVHEHPAGLPSAGAVAGDALDRQQVTACLSHECSRTVVADTWAGPSWQCNCSAVTNDGEQPSKSATEHLWALQYALPVRKTYSERSILLSSCSRYSQGPKMTRCGAFGTPRSSFLPLQSCRHLQPAKR